MKVLDLIFLYILTRATLNSTATDYIILQMHAFRLKQEWIRKNYISQFVLSLLSEKNLHVLQINCLLITQIHKTPYTGN